MKKTMILSAVAVMVMASAPAWAGPGGKGGPDGAKKGGHFAEVDTNGDGYIDYKEFTVQHEKMFKKLDTNGDGKISQDEMKAGKKEMKEKREEMKEKRMERRGDRGGYDE